MTGAEIAVVVAVVVAGATIKSITGLGLPLIAIPIITVFTGPETAVVVIALPNAVHNLFLVIAHRRAFPETIGLGRFAGSGIVGAVIGSVALGIAPDAAITVVLVVIVSAYLVRTVLAGVLGEGGHRLARPTAERWTPLAGMSSGIFQGAAGISGPIVGAWHHALGLGRDAFVLSLSTVFLVTGSTQIIVFARTGLFEGRLTPSILLSAVVIASIPLGRVLGRRVGGRGFDRAVLGLLAISVLALAVELVTGRR